MADLGRSSWLTAQGAVGSPQLVSLPELKLPEELFLLLRAQGSAARCLLALVDEAEEDCPELLQVGCGGHPGVALQPLLRGQKALPAGKLRHDVDLAPLRMMTRFE